MMAFGMCYRTNRALAAIKLTCSGSEEGVAERLPAGCIVQICRPAQFHSMVEARWGNEVYAVFEQDLLAVSEEARADSDDLAHARSSAPDESQHSLG